MTEHATTDPDARLAHLASGLPPILCFANDWNGDPTSKHHIMRILSRHVPVTWVESAGMRRPDLMNPADLQRIARRLLRPRPAADRRAHPAPNTATAEHGPGKRESQLRVVSPISIPLPGNRLAERVNARLYRRALKAHLTGTAPLHWVYTPTVAPYLDALPSAGLVYHCVDRWWAFTEYDPEVMKRHHAELCRRADVVFASAAELLEDCRPFAPDAVLMRHGVNWDHFSVAASAPPPRPADIADIDTPILGFFGLLHDWIDQDLLVQLARARWDATLVLIGKAPVDISRLTAEPNIRWLGQKPFAELPSYAAAFDVALVPFVRNELTAAVNPIKLLEYLSAGVPVVATALPEIVAMQPREGLTVAESADDFIAAVAVSSGKSAAERQAISDAQRGDSWQGRCAAMMEHVRSRLAAPLPGQNNHP